LLATCVVTRLRRILMFCASSSACGDAGGSAGDASSSAEAGSTVAADHGPQDGTLDASASAPTEMSASAEDEGTSGGEGSDDGSSGGDETGPPVHPLNPELEELAPNTWSLLASGGIEFEGHTAYSGGAYDSVRHQFLVFGGGHWDGWRNDVLAFDIATATWSALTQPDPVEDYACANVDEAQPGMLLSAMRPASRHTYDQLEFIDHIGQMLVWSGPTYSAIWECAGQTLPADTWLFDPGGASWSYRNLAAQPQPAGEAHSGGYDPIGGSYYAMRQGELWAYDVDGDAWTMLAPDGAPTSSSYTRVITVDRARQQLWMRPDVYDIATNSWSTSVASGAPPATLSEAYDDANDVIVVHSGAQVFGYHPDDDAWEVRDPENAITEPGDSGAGPYGRFFFDPVDGVVLVIRVVDYVVEVWAYRWA
jgi:hypothetical protein